MNDETIEVAVPAPAMPGLKVAIIGAGKMGGILLQAFLKNNLVAADQIFATVQHPDRAQALSVQFGVEVTTDNLAAAGVNVGLPRDMATLLAAQTTYGSARMVLETGYHPALLKDQVTTPAGCTVDGILELEEGGLRVTLIKAVKRATMRAKELANG